MAGPIPFLHCLPSLTLLAALVFPILIRGCGGVLRGMRKAAVHAWPYADTYLVQAWDVRNSCKHNGAVLPLAAAPVGRGADGVDAMA
jgi:hypothetical protein